MQLVVNAIVGLFAQRLLLTGEKAYKISNQHQRTVKKNIREGLRRSALSRQTLGTHRFVLNEADEEAPLNFDVLPVPVEEGENEVEEVALAQVVGRLLLEFGFLQGR